MSIDDIKNTEGILVLKMSASWCGPCKALAPVFEEISKEYPEANMHSIDVDDEPDLAEFLHIRSVPTIVFFNHGEEVQRVMGNVPKNDIIDIITKIIKACY